MVTKRRRAESDVTRTGPTAKGSRMSSPHALTAQSALWALSTGGQRSALGARQRAGPANDGAGNDLRPGPIPDTDDVRWASEAASQVR